MTRFEITADAPRVLDALCDEVRAGVDGDKLLAQARVILYERRYVIPAPRTVGELAKRARQTVEHEVSVAIERTIPPATRERWLDQLFEVRADGATLLEFLQEPAGSLRTKDIARESEKVSALLAMKIAEMPDLPGTERYWQMYAARLLEDGFQAAAIPFQVGTTAPEPAARTLLWLLLIAVLAVAAWVFRRSATAILRAPSR